ncbi:unnamed protein product [Prorocentrum cordatum]|uniref:Uncharacterized protein n=1 Tax=Prorocentrum cordatum TaxID=2364126 RepID=A0ABN9XJB7_9DINO|nr:unnamed protein product [Polarella glacialis]
MDVISLISCLHQLLGGRGLGLSCPIHSSGASVGAVPVRVVLRPSNTKRPRRPLRPSRRPGHGGHGASPRQPSEGCPAGGGPLVDPGLLDGVLECLGPRDLARAAAAGALLHRAAAGEGGVAERQLRRLIASTVALSRWRRPSGAEPRLPTQELHLAQSAVRHLQRIAGVYRLGSAGEVALEVAPDGYFVNYSANHRFVGQATVAKVVRAPEAMAQGYAEGHLYLLDRWYTECWVEGRRLAATELPFVDEDFRCFYRESEEGTCPALPSLLRVPPPTLGHQSSIWSGGRRRP